MCLKNVSFHFSEKNFSSRDTDRVTKITKIYKSFCNFQKWSAAVWQSPRKWPQSCSTRRGVSMVQLRSESGARFERFWCFWWYFTKNLQKFTKYFVIFAEKQGNRHSKSGMVPGFATQTGRRMPVEPKTAREVLRDCDDDGTRAQIEYVEFLQKFCKFL